ncbi:hypothetical protein V6N11_080310 [Hibiscus sabdariffa]|uniref:Uncharacterized protein n=1 Tax=Hibiscus sabdariffa TaxID=183260 RepID=A0ABR2R7B0_9ROSI
MLNDAASSFEPDCNVEVNDAAVVSDDDSLEENIGEASEIRVEYNSNYKDIYYEASKLRTHESGFTDSDAEASDDVSDVHAGVGDKVRVGIDDHNGNFDSLHIVDELDLDGPPRKQRFPEFNTTVDISDPTFKIRRASEPTVHQDQSTTPSPRPSQSGIHPQSNTPRPSQPLPPAYTARWMPTPTVPFTQESHTASPSQSRIHPQSNILMPSQPLPPSYTAKWMPTPTVPFT